MVVAFVMGRRRELLVLALALAAAMMVWLPTQRQLLHLPPASAALTWLPLLVMAALVAVAFGADRLVRGTARPLRWRAGLVAAAMLAALLSLPLLRAVVPPTSAVGVYLHRGYEPGRGLANLPEFARCVVRLRAAALGLRRHVRGDVGGGAVATGSPGRPVGASACWSASAC